MGKNEKKRAKEQAKELEKAARRASEAEAEARRASEAAAAAAAVAAEAPKPAKAAAPKANAPTAPKPSKAAETKPRHDTAEGKAGGHAAKAHGRPASVDASLPGTRDELLALHAAARRRRAAATYNSPEHRAAIDELGRIEIRIADVERSMTPPRG
jgi:hypothetical protein